jgi:hypothetical protein
MNRGQANLAALQKGAHRTSGLFVANPCSQ